jgi:hypothetical protein
MIVSIYKYLSFTAIVNILRQLPTISCVKAPCQENIVRVKGHPWVQLRTNTSCYEGYGRITSDNAWQRLTKQVSIFSTKVANLLAKQTWAVGQHYAIIRTNEHHHLPNSKTSPYLTTSSVAETFACHLDLEATTSPCGAPRWGWTPEK